MEEKVRGGMKTITAHNRYLWLCPNESDYVVQLIHIYKTCGHYRSILMKAGEWISSNYAVDVEGILPKKQNIFTHRCDRVLPKNRIYSNICVLCVYLSFLVWLIILNITHTHTQFIIRIVSGNYVCPVGSQDIYLKRREKEELCRALSLRGSKEDVQLASANERRQFLHSPDWRPERAHRQSKELIGNSTT